MELLQIDIEYIAIFIVLAISFILGLKQRNNVVENTGFLAVDLNMSNAMKGIACVFVLMGHWKLLAIPAGAHIPWGVSRLVWTFTANIALFWFMFFSGYGLSKKNYDGVAIGGVWCKRVTKIYLPLLMVCVVMVIIQALLPFKENETYGLETFTMLHNICADNIATILLRSLGWADWYVICILYFYSFFYLSLWLSKKMNISQTYILFVFLLMYLALAIPLCAYNRAHYYRYCWVFFLGHIVAKWNSIPNKKTTLFMLAVLALTLILENGMRTSNIILTDSAYVMAIIMLYVVSAINKRYEMHGKVMLFLGSISYFFYLSHIRIGFFLIWYVGVLDIMVWVFVSVVIAYILNIGYKKILQYVGWGKQ